MSEDHYSFDAKINTRGLRCPEPLMLIRRQIRQMSGGSTLLILADDPATTRDIPSLCRFMHHKLVHAQTQTLPYQYFIEIGCANPNQKHTKTLTPST